MKCLVSVCIVWCVQQSLLSFIHDGVFFSCDHCTLVFFVSLNAKYVDDRYIKGLGSPRSAFCTQAAKLIIFYLQLLSFFFSCPFSVSCFQGLCDSCHSLEGKDWTFTTTTTAHNFLASPVWQTGLTFVALKWRGIDYLRGLCSFHLPDLPNVRGRVECTHTCSPHHDYEQTRPHPHCYSCHMHLGLCCHCSVLTQCCSFTQLVSLTSVGSARRYSEVPFSLSVTCILCFASF